MIEAKDLTKTFGSLRAVDHLSFSVAKGERFVLLGTSGCGKTTTLKMLNRLIEPDDGSIQINGRDSRTANPEELRRGMGYVLQGIGLFPHYTIEKNIAVVPELLGWDPAKTRKRSAELLAKFKLDAETYFPLYPAQLSGGQQQRVGFARALVADPPILLMDEPLGALDPVTRQEIRNEFKQLRELKDKTIILVTHDIPEAIELGDKICVMDRGKAMQTGSAADLILHPANEFVKQFFGHGRFVLQLMALQLKDVLPYLQVSENVGTTTFTAERPLLDAVEALASDFSQPISVLDEESGKIYTLSFSDLFSGIQKAMSKR